MILGNATPDYRYGGIAGNIKPVDEKKFPEAPTIDIGPFQLRWQQMRLEAMSKWYQHWRDLSRYINPKRGFFEGFVPNYNAQIDYKLVMDGDPAQYARIMAAGMVSGLTSPSRPWFRLGLDNPDLETADGVKQWLEYAEKVLFAILAKSNIYGCLQQTYEELGLFGTGAFGIFEDFDTVARGRSYTIGEYYLSCDAAGRVNGFARQLWKTADQLVEEFGWNNVSQSVQRAYQAGQRDSWFLIYYLCEENTTRIEGLADFRGMKWRSLTWEAQSVYNKALSVKGYNEFPFMAPRWDMTTTADIYGVGPGWFALGDIKSLYRMKKDLFLGINKQADPPVLVDANVEGVANMLPGGITRTSSALPNSGARAAYQVQPDVKSLMELMRDMKQQISSRFFADLFMMMVQSDRSDMTAREVVERHEEKLLMLGPVLERIESDMLDPTIDRLFAIALRANLLPPAPPAIQGMPLKVVYISLLAQAQKMAGSAAIEQGASFVGALAANFPEVKDVFDPDAAAREYFQMLGVPPAVIRSPEQVMSIRRARAQIQQEQQQQAQALAAVQGAKVLADTKVGGGNALEQMLGVGPTQPAGVAQ